MEWSEVFPTLFFGMASLLLVVVGYLFSQMNESMREAKEYLHKMADSVEELNVKVAIVIERTDHHEKRIAKLEERP